MSFSRAIRAGAKSTKTAVLGVLLIVQACVAAAIAYLDGDPSTLIDANTLVAEIIAGVALIFARDADKTSERSGAR